MKLHKLFYCKYPKVSAELLRENKDYCTLFINDNNKLRKDYLLTNVGPLTEQHKSI